MKPICILLALSIFSLTSVIVTDDAQCKQLLSDNHKEIGLECASCHMNGNTKNAPTTEVCLGCHGTYDKLGVLTKDMPFNPHKNHFPDLDCTTCHHGHQPFENYCESCHGTITRHK